MSCRTVTRKERSTWVDWLIMEDGKEARQNLNGQHIGSVESGVEGKHVCV